MEVLEALKKGEKIRMKSWWWGGYVVKTQGKYRCDLGDVYYRDELPTEDNLEKWEIYNEEAHGKHNRDSVDAKYEDQYLREIGKLK